VSKPFSPAGSHSPLFHFTPDSIVHFTPESVVHFSPEYSDEKKRRHLSINFRNSIEDFGLTIHKMKSHKGRPSARKNGTPIEYDKFRQFFNLTLKFLADSESYMVCLDAFIKNFLLFVDNDADNLIFDLENEFSIQKVLHQLETRKNTIEKRLIESDNDTIEIRNRLRGEIDGIDYAIRTIKINM